MRLDRFSLLLISALFLSLVPVQEAAGHARLDRAVPEPGATIDWVPTEVRIWTTQELTLSGNALTVADADGTRVDNADAHVDQADPDRRQLVATVSPLASGTYTVTYTTTSADDGDTFTDSYTFVVAVAAADRAKHCLS